MGALSYKTILRNVQNNLNTQTETQGVPIFIETNPIFGLADYQTAISLFLLNRRPHPQQVLAAGKRTRYLLYIAVTCYGFDIEKFDVAEAKRDDLIGNVETALMKDRTIGSTVDGAWLEGGAFASAKGPQDQVFVAAGDVILVADCSTINP